MACQRSAATALTAAAFLTGLPLNAWAEEAENSTMAARSLRGSNDRRLQIVSNDPVTVVCNRQNQPCSSNDGGCCSGLECQPSGLLDGPDMTCQERPYQPPRGCNRQNQPCSSNDSCCAGLECQLSGLLDGPDRTCQERPYQPPRDCDFEGHYCRVSSFCCAGLECRENQCLRPYSPPPPPYNPPYAPSPPYSPAPPPYNPPYAPWRPPASGFGSSFELRYAGQRNTCMDVAGGHDKNFDKIQVWACGHPENQKFYFERMHGSSGRIRWAKDTSKCLDVKYGKTDVVIYHCHPDNSPNLDNQLFDVEAFENRGSTHIRWKGKCVDLNRGIVGSRHRHNSQVIVYDCHPYGSSGWIHQQWNVEYGA